MNTAAAHRDCCLDLTITDIRTIVRHALERRYGAVVFPKREQQNDLFVKLVNSLVHRLQHRSVERCNEPLLSGNTDLSAHFRAKSCCSPMSLAFIVVLW